jgi:hypothetical protein
VTNTYVEQTLLIARFTEWINIIAECNSYMHAIVSVIKRLYIVCITNSALLETLCLEYIADSKLQEYNLLCALET